MNKAGGIIAMVAGVFGVIAAIVTLTVGGLGSAFKADNADTVVALGWGGIAFSFLVIVLGAVAIFKPKGAGIGLIVCSVGGAILGGTIVAVFMVLSLIGGVVCVVGSRQKKENASAIQSSAPGGTVQGGEIYSQLERLADLKNKGVLTEGEFQAQKTKLLSGSQASFTVPDLPAPVEHVLVPAEVSVTKILCANCGKPLVPGAPYCGECGATVAVSSPTAAPAPPLPKRGRVVVWTVLICGALTVLILGAQFLMNRASTNSPLTAANTATGTATPQTSTVAAVSTAVANAAPVNPDILEFNSVEDLLNGYEEQARGRSVKVKGKINGFTLTDNSVELESTPNEHVVCNFTPGDREKFVNLDLERDQQITATLGNRVDMGETPMSGKTIYRIDLTGCRLQ